MARRIANFVVPSDNDKCKRDAGKRFLLREMSCAHAEEWATRAFLALASSGISIPDDVAASGMAGLAAYGLQAIGGLQWRDAKPLMDEMMECVTICPDPAKPTIDRPLVDDDIEEVMTRYLLRKAVWQLHINFSSAA